jgi:hypothetical protein
MKLKEFSSILEARMVWRKQGNKIKRAVRCTSGPRKGRVVATSSQCSKPINIAKRINLKRTKARLGGRMRFKAKRTKRMNPLSRRLRTLNKRR